MFSASLQRALHGLQGSITRAQYGCDCNDCTGVPAAAFKALREGSTDEPQAVLCEEAQPDDASDVPVPVPPKVQLSELAAAVPADHQAKRLSAVTLAVVVD